MPMRSTGGGGTQLKEKPSCPTKILGLDGGHTPGQNAARFSTSKLRLSPELKAYEADGREAGRLEDAPSVSRLVKERPQQAAANRMAA